MNAFMFEDFFTSIIIKAYRFQVQKEKKSSGGDGAVRENGFVAYHRTEDIRETYCYM